MKCIKWLVVAMLGLQGCGTTGPVFNVQDDLPEWVFSPHSDDPESDQAPVSDASTITFQLSPGQSRSTLKTGEEWRVGRSYLFGFDVRADPENLGAERLVISRFARAASPEDELATVVLTRKSGATVFGRTCIAPENLAEWHRIEMRVRLANKDTGFLEVFCDRKPIWAQANMRTTVRPVCRLSEGCDTDVTKPTRFSWRLGVMAERNVQSPVEIEMQRLHQRVIFYIPNRAGTL